MLAGASPVKRLDHLAASATRGERPERAAIRLPGADRAQQPQPGVLGELFPVAAIRRAHARDDRADQRLVAAQQLLHGAPVVALRGLQQRPQVKRGTAPWSMRGGHARAR